MAIGHSVVFHIPEVAELVVSATGRAAGLVSLHGESAQHQSFDQGFDGFDGSTAYPFRVSEGVLQSILYDRECPFIERFNPQGVRDDPVSAGRDFGEEVGITACGHLFGSSGDDCGVGQHAEWSRAGEGLFGTFEGD